jgi:Holliday junction resolvase
VIPVFVDYKKNMTEQRIQKKITDQLTNDGWFVIKLMKTSINGIPDLMALRNGTTKFIEVKKPRGIISEIQKYRIKQLRKQGFEAVVMDGIDSIIY